jgi:hypothetical protein
MLLCPSRYEATCRQFLRRLPALIAAWSSTRDRRLPCRFSVGLSPDSRAAGMSEYSPCSPIWTAISLGVVVVFGHAGIALAAAVILDGLLGRHAGNEPVKRTASSAEPAARWRSAEVWVVSLSRRLDMRLLLLGSIVSDIVDNPAALEPAIAGFGVRERGHHPMTLNRIASQLLYSRPSHSCLGMLPRRLG